MNKKFSRAMMTDVLKGHDTWKKKTRLATMSHCFIVEYAKLQYFIFSFSLSPTIFTYLIATSVAIFCLSEFCFYTVFLLTFSFAFSLCKTIRLSDINTLLEVKRKDRNRGVLLVSYIFLTYSINI